MFYLPPNDVIFYTGDPRDDPTVAGDSVRPEDPLPAGCERQPASVVVLTAAFESAGPDEKVLRWSNWRNYQYPMQGVKHPLY